MTSTGWIILIILNIPVYLAVAWVFFRTWDDFWEAIKFWATPDIISLFHGEYLEDRWAEIKLFLWIASCVACVFGEAQLAGKFFG